MRKFSVQEGYITKMYLQINKNKNVFLIMSRHKINLGKSKVNKKLFCSARNNWFKKNNKYRTNISSIVLQLYAFNSRRHLSPRSSKWSICIRLMLAFKLKMYVATTQKGNQIFKKKTILRTLRIIKHALASEKMWINDIIIPWRYPHYILYFNQSKLSRWFWLINEKSHWITCLVFEITSCTGLKIHWKITII